MARAGRRGRRVPVQVSISGRVNETRTWWQCPPLAGLIALGCLLGAATAATVAGTTLVSAAPASAKTCSGAFRGFVDGGRSSNHYGAEGSIYVNDQATVDAYDYGFVRSLYVEFNAYNAVEVGWSAHISGTTSPQVFAEWYNGGTRGFFNYNKVNFGTDVAVRVENDGHIGIFRFYLDGESQPFAYSPTMGFQAASPRGNSERNFVCQSLYTHMFNLGDETSTPGTWETWDNWNYCKNESSGNPYYMHKDSDTELHVNSDSSGAMC
jgi:hypothetical protein